MEPFTGHAFEQINQNFKTNFKEASNLRTVNYLETSLRALESLYGQDLIFFSGSLIEGGRICLEGSNIKSIGSDVDVIISMFSETFDAAEQQEYFHDVPGAPGYVIVDITNDAQKMHGNNMKVEVNGIVYASASKTKAAIKDLFDSSNMHKTRAFHTSDNSNMESASVQYAMIPQAVYSKTDSETVDALDKALLHAMPNINKEKRYELCKLLQLDQIDMDLVPCIYCEFWPLKQARDWIFRKRSWPPAELVREIFEGGYHLVPKASHGGNTEIEWRISFSKAERTLAENRTLVQQKCFNIVKIMHKEGQTVSDVIKTYHLKTVMMWAMERRPAEYWREDNLSQCVLGLLNDLLHAVTTGQLPHYFIPENNLLGHVAQSSLIQEGKCLSKLIAAAANSEVFRPGRTGSPYLSISGCEVNKFGGERKCVWKKAVDSLHEFIYKLCLFDLLETPCDQEFSDEDPHREVRKFGKNVKGSKV